MLSLQGLPMQHHVHLICGSTGAGKTAYSRDLTAHLRGVRFSIDEWMSTLFWMDTPQPLEAQWSLERVARCTEQIWHTVQQVAHVGVPSVLDLGFSTADSRAQIYVLARETGLSAQVHLLDVSAEERWRRVERRNAEQGAGQLPFAVSREMFDFVDSIWEPPTVHEMLAHDGIVAPIHR
jgi:predicted kinase